MMKITLPKTKSSHLLLKRRFRKSSTPIYFSYKLWTVDQRFRAFFSDPQHKIQVWMEGLFQIPTNRYLTMISNMRTPGAQVPLLLATLQSRVMNTSEAADDGGVNPWILRGFLFFFSCYCFLAVWKISFNDLFKTIGYKLTCCFLDQGKGLIVSNPTKGEDHDFQTFWDQVSGISPSSFPGKQYGRLVLECSIVDHFQLSKFITSSWSWSNSE